VELIPRPGPAGQAVAKGIAGRLAANVLEGAEVERSD